MKSFTRITAIATLTALSAAQSSIITATSSAASSAVVSAPTVVTDCHLHGETPYCFAGEDEWELESEVDPLADAYTDCHPHDDGELHCDSPEEVTFVAAAAEDEDGHSSTSANSTSTSDYASASTTPATSTEDITEVSGCHAHGDELFCFNGEDEWEVENGDVNNAPGAYTDCHAHGETELHCDSPEEATLTLAATTDEDHAGTTASSGESTGATASAESSGTNGEAAAEKQATGNLASTSEISGALVMLGAAVVALCIF